MSYCLKKIIQCGRGFLLCFSVVLMSAPVTADDNQSTLRVSLNTANINAEFNPFDGHMDDLVRGTFFEPLVIFNSLTNEVHYRLAESFKYSGDLKSITYKLRKGLKWSDGTPLTADDVVFSISLGKRYEKIDVGGLWSSGNLRSVQKIDAETVRFRFSRINTIAELVIPNYYIVPKHVWSKVEDVMTFLNSEKPVGSGPITEIADNNEKNLRMCRNPHYYRENEPHIDCINYLAFDKPGALREALASDQLDWADGFIEDVKKNFIAKDKEHYKVWYPPHALVNYYFNTRKKPFNNLKFRQAVSMALDRDTIVDLAAYGYPKPEHNVVGIGLYYKTHFDEEINQKYRHLTEYNPKKASAMLDAEGYKDIDGDGFRELPNGKPMTFNIMTMGGWPEWEQASQMVSEYLNDIGIYAEPKPVGWEEYDRSLKEGSYEMIMNWTLSDSDPILTYKEYYHSSRVGLSWHAGHGLYSNQVDSWINEYAGTNHKPSRRRLLQRLMNFTAKNLPFIPIWSNRTWFNYNTRYIVGWPSEEDPYVHPFFPDPGSKLLIFSRLKPRS